MTAQEVAIDLIKPYVDRGDDPSWIKGGMMGSYCTKYHAQISGYLDGKRYNSDHILITKIGDQDTKVVVKFWDIYNKLKSSQLAMELV